MTANTKIEWTDHTFNVAWGCIKVSPGCENCYAATFAKRTGHDVWGPAKTTPRRTFGAPHWEEPTKWERAAADDLAGGVCPSISGRLVFCSSMADVFEDHPTIDAEREKLWPLIRVTPHLTWQILTKRPERVAANLPSDWGADGYANVWLGTSIESPDYIGRFDALSAVPARVHFLSLEPLLADVAPVLYDRFMGLGPDANWWCIVGGESGPGARPFDIAWVDGIARACDEFAVSLFVKQLGAVPMERETAWRQRRLARLLNARRRERVPEGFVPLLLNDAKGGDWTEWPEDVSRRREFPAVQP